MIKVLKEKSETKNSLKEIDKKTKKKWKKNNKSLQQCREHQEKQV